MPYPYRIFCRYLEYLEDDTWREPFVIWEQGEVIKNLTCDFTFNTGEGFLLVVRSIIMEPDCRFYGGNGVGYLTPNSLTYLTLSTIGGTWSYLAWMEGERDIYLHFYFIILFIVVGIFLVVFQEMKK